MRLLIITQKVDKDDDVLGFFCYWISNLAKHFDSIKVISLSKGKFDLPSNVEVVSLGKEKKYPKIFQAIFFYFYAFKFLLKTDDVFVHMAPEYVRALYPLNIFFRKPIIMWYAHIKVSPTAKWAIKHVNYILTPSKESFEIESEKVISTGHGIDTNLFRPIPNIRKGKKKILAVSRISKVKRIEIFIKSLGELKNKKPELDFVAEIVGSPARPEDFSYQEELKQLVSSLGLEERVVWKGSVRNMDIPALYNSSDLFVRLQGGGGFGKTELEAFACGVPVILPTTVYNGILSDFSGDMYFPEDDYVKCAENMANILAWKENRKQEYSQKVREFVVENHNIEKLSDKIAEEFAKLK
ncbi:hypothetical protein COW81_03490 [Candidatus Campbellbacteria bacterium CG22_combo_CG10-13_8_21_14_all_36_13]|uniref:Glycosyl transferase family 1 domain-containing protein n=1 Tax=Candidatus Campbellbacteria bacterium CG22_combo_CG10-13_8_21_14_all_36_13 TaxID=1974529 RepID=A0A2H0DXC9_9BACT|nr:MAG: hypothetical protein COW81_03490 [Candidatus Campbellbacteria bacterium CG22_combo_CG10-13_8_21_14_all_36_13]